MRTLVAAGDRARTCVPVSADFSGHLLEKSTLPSCQLPPHPTDEDGQLPGQHARVLARATVPCLDHSPGRKH